MQQVDNLAEQALEKIIERLTDLAFLEIQENRVLIQQYLRLLKNHDVETVNSRIGNYIRKRLDLSNLGREENPLSTLIKSYEKHGMPPT